MKVWLKHPKSSILWLAWAMCNIIASTVLAIMVALISFDVVLRYFFNSPILGSFEITEFLMVILVFFGLAQTQVKKRHIVATDLLSLHLRERTNLVKNVINDVISAFFVAILAWMTIVQARVVLARQQVSGTLAIPIWPIMVLAALGLWVLFLVVLIDLFYSIAMLRSKERKER